MTGPRWIWIVLGGALFAVVTLLAGRVLAGPERVLLSGNFHSVAHKGTGEARVVVRGDGRRMLRLMALKTYPGEELEACLVGAPDAEDNDTVRQAGRVCLGPYDPKAQWAVYELPPGIDLRRYRAVAIWSRPYQVNFTTAPLSQ